MASSARIEELEKKFNENPRRYFAPLANEYRKAGETEQAIALCRAYLPQQPGHMSGHIVFGQALFDAGEIDEAQGVFETALSLDPENLIALRHLGDIAHSRGDIAGARSWYRRVLDADPRNEEIAAQLAALPEAGAETAPASTPATDESSVGWGDINPERSEPEGEKASETAAAASPELQTEHVAASSGSPEAAPAPTLEIERAADQGDDIDIDALFSTTDQHDASPAAPAEPSSIAEEKTAELPVFEKAPDEPAEQVEEASAVGGGGPDDAQPGIPAVAAGSRDPAASTPPSPRPSASDDIGLEVAEFIPPPRSESSEHALGFETGHEAVVGGPVGEAPGGARGSSTPAGFVTETMAELYLQQGFVQEALAVYRQLLEQNPEDAALRERIESLEHGARSSVSMAAVSDEVVEAARKRQASPNRRSMRQFLGSLAARRPPQREAIEEPADDSVRAARVSGEAQYPETEASMEPAAEALPFEPQPASDSSFAPASSVPHDLPFEPAESEPLPYEAPSSRAPRTSHDREAIRSDEPSYFAAPSAPQADDGLDALFAGADIDPDDHAAATTLAGAFDSTSLPAAPAGPRGRPTRAAPSELSLDNVFRESGGDAGLQKPRSDFSFDQFFSDDATASSSHANGDEGPAEPSAEPPSPDDIGQFNAWLEGLKKK